MWPGDASDEQTRSSRCFIISYSLSEVTGSEWWHLCLLRSPPFIGAQREPAEQTGTYWGEVDGEIAGRHFKQLLCEFTWDGRNETELKFRERRDSKRVRWSSERDRNTVFVPRSYPLWMSLLAMRKANRRLRGSLSPSMDCTKPNTKSAPKPLSSVGERSRETPCKNTV